MILNFLLFVERFLFIQRKLYSLFGCPKGAVFCPTAVGTRGKGGILFPKRIPPLEPPEKGLGLAVSGLSNSDVSEVNVPRARRCRISVAIRFDLLLLSAVAQPLAALLPYGCGTPLAGAALPIL